MQSAYKTGHSTETALLKVQNDILEPMQSAYKTGHSTETALLKEQNDILMAIDKQK